MPIIETLIAKGLMPSVISGGSALLGGLLNAGSQLGTNSSQLSYAKEMYDKQRADALTDYATQNAYNAPKQQMARFKEAGLNPNLIYGQMTNSPVVRSSSPQSYNPTAPQVDLAQPAGMALNAYYDTQLKTAQIDLVKAQTDATLKEALVKLATNDTLRAKLPFVSQQADADLSGSLLTNQTKDYTNKNLLPQEWQKNKAQISQIIASTSLSNETKQKVTQEITNLKQGETLNDLLIKLKQMGLNESDNVILRMLVQLFQKAF